MPLNRKLKTTFGKVSGLYHSARIGYASKLFSDIVKISNIKKNSVILDVGSGTGKSAEFFAKHGYNLIGLDIGKELVSIAKAELQNYPNLSFKIGSFEKTKFKPNTFDLIISGQAFHWLDPYVACKNSAKFLKKGGFLAIFSKFQKKDLKFSPKIWELFIRHCPDYPADKLNYLSYAINISEKINKSNLFFKPIIKKYNSKFKYSKKQYRDLIMSFSWTSSLNKGRKELFLKELGKMLNSRKWPYYVTYDNVLIIAKVKK
ncbi:methyltransferase domain-containing protein [Candidatus Pacearchaeota archaeon]|nr:methyltransferase domain-containing protein [Candidatus Pacearchaeota archaeon]